MSGSLALQIAVRDAKCALEADPEGRLTREYRARIWRAIGPPGGASAQQRARLAARCAWHVLPIWERMRPGDHRPRHLLLDAEFALRSGGDPTVLLDGATAFWSALDSLWATQKEPRVMYAGYAAAKAAMVAALDEACDESDTAAVSDDEADPYHWDAALFASLAYAGDGRCNVDVRREFWWWYLCDAVARGYPARC